MIDRNKMPKIQLLGDKIDKSFAKKLDEGYFKSFPSSSVKKAIERFLEKKSSCCGDFEIQDETEHGSKDEENDFQILLLAVEKIDYKTKEELNRILSQCGWYIGTENKPTKEAPFFSFVLEPKFPNENSTAEIKSKKLIEKYKIFYHISYKKFKDKILHDGLVPSLVNRQDFDHPERIYLFSDIDVAKQFAEMGYTNLLSFTKELHLRKTRNKKSGEIAADNKYQDVVSKDKDYIVAFEVDLYQMMKDGKTALLYHDNRFNEKEKAYFTQTSINPKYIKLLKI